MNRGDVTGTLMADVSSRPTPRFSGGRSAGISDGNRDGNDGSHQRPDATTNSHLLPAHPA
jgi:hypothetical protein